MDVFAVGSVNKVGVCSSHRRKDGGHHDEREHRQSTAPNPAVVHQVGCSIVAHQLHDTDQLEAQVKWQQPRQVRATRTDWNNTVEPTKSAAAINKAECCLTPCLLSSRQMHSMQDSSACHSIPNSAASCWPSRQAQH